MHYDHKYRIYVILNELASFLIWILIEITQEYRRSDRWREHTADCILCRLSMFLRAGNSNNALSVVDWETT